MDTKKMSVTKIRQFHERWLVSISQWRRDMDQIKKDQADAYDILRKVRALVDDHVGHIERLEERIEDLEVLIDDVDWELRLDRYERLSKEVVDVPYYDKQVEQHETLRKDIIDMKRNHELLYKQLQLLNDSIQSNLL
jgi:predicted  nucleic acid-binding Zn-ribbon protein